jgi:hypothetical protein
VRRWALRASLPLALLLIPVPGASAATCTATASGAWTAPSSWDCGVPGESDAVVIPAGRTISLADGDTQAAARLTLGGTLALGDQSELDADGLAASGGTLAGPQYAMLVVTVEAGAEATVDTSGLTVNGAYLNVTGAGTFGISGPLMLSNGGWVESDIDATWTGSAPWQLGGAAGTPTSGFEMFGAQLAIDGATSAQRTGSGGDGVIQLDGGATLFKQDATTTELGVGVLIDTAEIHVVAGKLIGNFQGAGSLSIASGATLALAGSGLQIAPPAVDMAGGTLEVQADSDIALILPRAPALHRLGIGAGAELDVSIDNGTSGPVDVPSPPDALADEIAIAARATLSMDSGAGTLALAEHDALSGSGTLDGSLLNSAGTVSPNGELSVTGDYAQGAGGTLALDLRSAGDGDSLRVAGSAGLAGTLHVTTAYVPAATATPLVLAAAAKPSGTFAEILAPLPSGRAWDTTYSSAGVELAVGSAAGSAGAPALLSKPSLQPAEPVVGGSSRCLPGKWKGAHALAYQWLRGGKPIASATTARYRVTSADRGRKLACRVTATATGGAHAAATSKRARARLGLRIGTVTMHSGGRLSVALHCAASERRCSGSLQVLVAGHVAAAGHFAVRSPGGVVDLAPVGTRGRPGSGDAAVVHAGYRNGTGAARDVKRRVVMMRS